jgi:hypothetical protein
MMHTPLMRHFVKLGSAYRWVMWVAPMGSIGALATACFDVHSCTEIGCADQAAIVVREVDLTFGPLEFELVVDGRSVKCSSPMIGEGSCDDPMISVGAQELADCVETRRADAISEVCTPNGKFEHGISIQGTPARVEVIAIRPDGTTQQREFKLVYSTQFPNGPDCEPACKHAAAAFTL